MTLRNVMRFFILWILLLAVWMIYTFDFHAESLMLGTGLSLITTIFTYPIFFNKGHAVESRFIYRWDLAILYFVFLIIQSYLASFTLIYQMLTGRYTSGVVRIKTRLKSRIGKTMLANTISLIPGTLSLWLEGNYIYVHWFDQKSRHRLQAERIIKEPMESLLMKLFG